jgi:hypothetical protein
MIDDCEYEMLFSPKDVNEQKAPPTEYCVGPKVEYDEGIVLNTFATYYFNNIIYCTVM